MLHLYKAELLPHKPIHISGSKSESNRLLILQKILKNINLENISNSKDTKILENALNSKENLIDIQHTGTAMRFLTAYLAIQEGKTSILTGSERMKQRPIKELVTAIKELGGDIEYLEKYGYPPLKIKGKKLNQNNVTIKASISSQFITALLLIGATFKKGLNIKLLGNITSQPYLEMTLKLLNQIGVETSFSDGNISILPPKKLIDKKIIIESDWSSASYFYSLAAIGRKSITLKNFKPNSLQGDFALVNLYKHFFGVQSFFHANGNLTLQPIENFTPPKKIELNMNRYPDIAQTLCVTASALKIPFSITGLETLKIKETDRLIALKNELLKIGVKTKITSDAIQSSEFFPPQNNISITTYQDHRMAMSFAPFCLIQNIKIDNPNVVEKSYPNFWKDLYSVIKKL